MSTSIRKEADKVPEPTLRRLPWYLSNIKLMKEKGEQYVSSTQISKEINIDASQIAKDLSYVNISGRTRVGYNIDALIEVLESFLGFTNMHKAFLFGVGSLGAALLRDSGLHHFGLEIVAAFDVNPELVGKDLNGIPIFHSDDFEAKMKEYGADVIGRKIVPDDLEIIAEAISDAAVSSDVILCTGGMSVDPDDKTPGAVRRVGADTIFYGAPVLPGAMFLLAYYEKNGRRIPVMGLPGCVMYSKRTVFDLILPRVLAGDLIDDIGCYGQGGLCLNCEACTFPNCGFGK